MKSKHSINYRLALNMAIVFLIVGLILLPLFVSVRLKTLYHLCEDQAQEFAYRLTVSDASANDVIANASVRVKEIGNDREVYRFGERPYNPSVFRQSLRRVDGKRHLFLRYEMSLTYGQSDCEAVFYFDCHPEGQELLRECRVLCFWYVIIATLLILLFYFFNRAVLRPIDDITHKVQTFQIQTIHKDRLDVNETDAELRTLAEEINRLLDRIEHAYEAQKQFVSEASHELRTPITVLQGYSAMLRRWGASDKEVLAESVEAIESEAKSMQELVEKLLFLSRHERRKLPFHKERFDMKEIITELEKEMSYTIRDTRSVKCECESVFVYGDKQALKQAFRVFLDNARKYTEEGDSISIFCRNRQGACEVKIEDTGIGMQRADVEGIFSRFFRADTVRGKNIEGHGLGLSIARLIIDGHAGRITVRSQYTKGSTFIITIPRQRGV